MPVSRRTVMTGAAALGAFAALGVPGAKAARLSLDDAMSPRVMGDENAPVQLIEFFSLGCPHCRDFHDETLPTLKKEYIDPGKVRMEFRDYPLDVRALAAAMITRCAPKERYFGLVDLMFRTQAEWAVASNAVPSLKQVARFGGLSGDDVEACLNDQKLLDTIRERAQADAKEYDFSSTPTFVVGKDHKKISGAQPIDVFRKVLDAELG